MYDLCFVRSPNAHNKMLLIDLHVVKVWLCDWLLSSSQRMWKRKNVMKGVFFARAR